MFLQLIGLHLYDLKLKQQIKIVSFNKVPVYFKCSIFSVSFGGNNFKLDESPLVTTPKSSKKFNKICFYSFCLTTFNKDIFVKCNSHRKIVLKILRVVD